MEDLSHLDGLPEIEGIQQPTPIPEGEEDLCRVLWLAVFVQAVQDAKSQRSRPCFKKYKDCALKWIDADTEELRRDFEKVCHLAGVNPKRMRAAIKEALKSKKDNFNFRWLMKFPAVKRPSSPESRKSYMRRTKRDEMKRLRKARERSFETLELEEENLH